MGLKQTLKALFVGFCFGFGLTWLLAVIIPFRYSVSHNDVVLIESQHRLSIYIITGEAT